MVFGQKLEILSFFVFQQIVQTKVFYDLLDRNPTIMD